MNDLREALAEVLYPYVGEMLNETAADDVLACVRVFIDALLDGGDKP